MVGEFASGGNVSQGKIVRDGLLYKLWLRSSRRHLNLLLGVLVSPVLNFVTLVCMIAVAFVPLP
jgi:hypothetical protein